MRTIKYPYPYCLCVIDVQQGFATANKVVHQCTELVKTAINDGAFIVVAQYIKYGNTYSDITNILITYAHPQQYAFCWANEDSKYTVVNNLLYRYNIHTNHLVFCGINTSACVRSTVTDFSQYHSEKNLSVVQSACADFSVEWHKAAIKDINRKCDNVDIITWE